MDLERAATSETDVTDNTERKEVPSFFPYWLGAFFETGGYLGLVKGTVRFKSGWMPTSLPLVSYNDSDAEALQKLRQVAGGNLYEDSEKSTRLSWRHKAGGEFAIKAYGFAPSRKGVLDLYQIWLDHMSPVVRLMLLDEYKALPVHQEVDSEVYDELVAQNAFVAGVVDSRVRIKAYEKYYHEYMVGSVGHRLAFPSMNRPLLESLKRRFGGYIEVSSPEGRRITIGGKEYFTQHESLEWSLNQTDSLALATEVLPFSIMRTHILTQFIKDVGGMNYMGCLNQN